MTESAPVPASASSRDQDGLAAVLAQMGAVVLSTQTVNTAVELVTALAVEAVPGASGAGVTVVDERGERSMAASSSLVERADALQYRLGAGPCLTSWRDQASVRVDDVLADTRWPNWSAEAVEVGVRSMLSVPLTAAGLCVGAIKVYSAVPAAFDDRAEQILQLFARQAAVLLVNTQTLADARQISLGLNEALKHRDVIGRAKGVLLAQGAVDDGAAFAMLVGTSQRTNTKLHTVAQQLVGSVTGRLPAVHDDD